MYEFDIAVIGGGPAGMAAALAADAYTLARPLRVAIIERAPGLGGILNQCTHTGFGLIYFGEELTGQEYAKRFAERVGKSSVEVFSDTMVLDISEDRLLTLSGKKTGLALMRAKAVILASGCRERPIGSLPIAGTRPSGVYSAGMAQKMMNLGGYDLGERFIILGSGDVGMIVARHLAQAGKEVLAVVEKEDHCGGLERNRINCLEQYGIPLLTETTITRVHGAVRITGVTLTGPQGESFAACDTLITSVGLIPERELLDGLLRQDAGFAAGDDGSNAPKRRFGGLVTRKAHYNGFPAQDADPGAAQKPGSRTTTQSGDGGAAQKTLPNWLFLCGNACYVHDVVDDVTVESERAGSYAAEFVIRSEAGNAWQQADDTNTELQTTNAASHTQAAASDIQAAAATAPHAAPHANTQSTLCIACPKGCVPIRTSTGWQGLACGRDTPVFA